MIYNIYFSNRQICIQGTNLKEANLFNDNLILCKNTKSFDIAYNEFINNEEIVLLNISCPLPDVLFKHIKKKYKIVKAAGGAVLNQKSELLIIKRGGYWDLPKGKIEKNETKKNAAIREVEEECGIEGLQIVSKIGKTYHTYHFKGENILKVTHWYSMKYNGEKIGTPQTEEDITEVKWIVKSEIDQIIDNTHKNLIQIFKIVQKS